MLAKLLIEQAKDAFIQKVAGTVVTPGSYYLFDLHGIMVRTASIYGAVLIVETNSLQPLLFPLSHYPNLAGNPGERRTYDTMTRELS